jgi:hypothetical protein
MSKKLFPIPEAIDGRKWVVTEGFPSTDTRGRAMHVPTSAEDYAVFVRAHEMGHAKITPKIGAAAVCSRRGISMLALQCIEDHRVHRFLEDREVRMTGGMGSPEEIQAFVQRIKGDARTLGGAVLSSSGTDDERHLRHAIEEFAPEAEDILRNADIVIDAFRREERRAARRSVGLSRYRASPKGFNRLTIPHARLFDALFPEGGAPSQDGKIIRKYREDFSCRSHVKWGKLTGVIKLRMTATRAVKSIGGRVWRDEGAVPIAPYRMVLDGRMFARKKREKGGTVLVDLSGSMNLSQDDIREIIKTAPGATVAVYAGRNKHGVIAIAASGGRMATEDTIRSAMPGCGNIIDGPALRWLAKMPAPRVWVSDAVVTGEHDQCGTNLIIEAMSICRNADIKRVERATAVPTALR